MGMSGYGLRPNPTYVLAVVHKRRDLKVGILNGSIIDCAL